MKKNYRLTSVFVLLVVLALGGIYLASVGAEDRGWDPHFDGPKPASEVPDAPLIQLAAEKPVIMLATFDEQPEGWERIQHDIALPDEYGVWESDSGKLSQDGTVSGAAFGSFAQTIFLAPPVVGREAIVSTQVFPQGNHVVGLVFGATDEGHYHYRVFRGSLEASDPPAINHKLEYYNMKTDEYRVLAENDELQGFGLGRWQELRVSLDGDTITCYFDGQKAFEVNDPALSEGQTGVYTLARGDVLFDNFVILQP